MSARDLFYAPRRPRRKHRPPAKRTAPKKAAPAGESQPPAAVEAPASAAPAERDASPTVSSGGAHIIRTAYTGKPLGLRYSILRNNGGDDYREAAPDTVFHSAIEFASPSR